MALLVDLFGYLSVVLHGLTIVAQSMALGGVLFLLLLVAPARRAAGRRRRPSRATPRASPAGRRSAWCLRGARRSRCRRRCSPTPSTSRLPQALTAASALAGLVKIAAAAVLAVAAAGRRRRARRPRLLLLAGAVELAAATLTTHAAARLDDRAVLLASPPCTSSARPSGSAASPASSPPSRRVHDGASWRLIGARFSRMSMAGVACILVSAAVLAVFLYRRVGRRVRHRLWRHGRRQDGHVRRPAAARASAISCSSSGCAATRPRRCCACAASPKSRSASASPCSSPPPA